MAREMKDSGVEWIGEIPITWKAQKAKFLIASCDGGIWGEEPEGTDDDIIVLRSTEQLVDGTWQIDSPAYRSIKSDSRWEQFLLRSGDLVITKSSGSPLHIGKTSLVTTEIELMNCCYSNFMQRIRVNKAILPQLAWYNFNSDLVRAQFNYMSNTTSGINNINATMILNVYLPVPPNNEQREIIRFLNRSCSKIDDILEKARNSIEEYKKLKQAVITQAVTKGVRGDRPMKDSGIEWMEKIPAEWDIEPITKKLDSIVDYRGKTPEKVDDGIFLVTAKNIKEGRIDYEFSQEYVNPDDYEEIMHRGKPMIGDVLFTTEAPLGAVANVDRVNIALAQRIIKFSPNKSLNAYYLKYWILGSGFQQFLKSLSTGSTATGIKASKLFMLKIAVPMLPEQKEIVTFLDAKCAEIDALIAKKEQFLAEMENYKKSLIYEYVTGKKEVY